MASAGRRLRREAVNEAEVEEEEEDSLGIPTEAEEDKEDKVGFHLDGTRVCEGEDEDSEALLIRPNIVHQQIINSPGFKVLDMLGQAHSTGWMPMLYQNRSNTKRHTGPKSRSKANSRKKRDLRETEAAVPLSGRGHRVRTSPITKQLCR